MAIRTSPQEYADKHARNLKNSVEDIRRGLERVTESPTAKAAAKADKMLQNLSQSVQSGKWAARLNSVSLEDWKAKAINKGLGRIAAGVDAAHDKQVEFATQLFAHEEHLLAELTKMPDLVLEDSINRATTWIRGMAKFKRR